jgi:hypothetical protein
MAKKVKRGDIIRFDFTQPPLPKDCLFRTPSTYSYGENLELRPYDDIRYTVCDGSAETGFHLVKTDNIKAPLGFCLLYIDDVPHIRISQVGFDPERVDDIHVEDFDPNPPKYGCSIGSDVIICSHADLQKVMDNLHAYLDE